MRTFSVGRTSVIACVSIVLGSAPAMAQAPKGTPPPAHLDFRAFTDNGQPVGDLKPEDLSLKVNGKPRPVGALTLYQSLPPDAGSSAPGVTLPPPYATNVETHHGRVIYILADDDSIAAGHDGPLKDALRLLTTELGPDDRVGLTNTVGQVNIRPTGDIARVRVAADALVGKALTTETEADAACRTTHVLETLDAMLAITGDTPTTLLVFSAGLTGPSAQAVTLKGARGLSLGGTCPVQTEDFQRIGSAASAASVDMYLFGLTEGRATHSSAQDAGFQSLAGVTGAEYVSLSGGADAPMARMLRETSAYYEATFVPDAADLGSRLRVELRSTRAGVKVRARPAVDAARANAAGPAVSPKEMMRTATVFHDLPLRAAGFVSPNPGSDDVKVVAMFEGADPSATLTSASVGLFDDKGTLKKQWTAQPADLAKRPVMAALGAAPGGYRMRVAAVDSTGRSGTADYDLHAEIPRADPLKLSTLVLGTQQQGGGLAPRMDFSTEPVAIGYLEIYNVPTGGKVTVELDITQAADGAALATAPTNVNVSPSNPDTRIAFGGFDISGMKPGDYLVRAVISLDGKPVGKVVRTLRKTE